MGLPVRPAMFYGSALPRPRIYSNGNGNERVDPPTGVMEALLEWAADAPWSAGGLSHKRTTSVGSIAGSTKRLKAFHDDLHHSKAFAGRHDPETEAETAKGMDRTKFAEEKEERSNAELADGTQQRKVVKENERKNDHLKKKRAAELAALIRDLQAEDQADASSPQTPEIRIMRRSRRGSASPALSEGLGDKKASKNGEEKVKASATSAAGDVSVVSSQKEEEQQRRPSKVRKLIAGRKRDGVAARSGAAAAAASASKKELAKGHGVYDYEVVPDKLLGGAEVARVSEAAHSRVTRSKMPVKKEAESSPPSRICRSRRLFFSP